ncbi:MAG TPA: ATPase, T2SS/T4P/T4SS family [Pirellulales bacterium]|nr:ATPase, T2SS/T4P/T4SS family [Pirellulales bacterium]
MRRLPLIVSSAVCAWTACPPAAHAQREALARVTGKISADAFGKLAVLLQVAFWIQIALTVVVFMIWVRSADWTNCDRFFRRQGRNWNLLLFVPFLVCLPIAVGLEWLPPFGLASPFLLFFAYVVPFSVYVSKRNANLPYDEKVFTKKHIRRWTSSKFRAIGIKMAAEEKTLDDIGPPVTLVARGGATERDNTVNMLTARQSPGFLVARELLAQTFGNRAEAILLDFSATSVAVRFQIDGVWNPGQGLEREPGDLLLAVLKTICALNAADRRTRQAGSFGVEFEGKKRSCRLTSQGTKTGERALIQFDNPDVKKKRLADLGMRQKMIDELKPLVDSRGGLIVVSAPPGGGLTSLFHAVLSHMDRYTRGFITIEDKAAPEVEVENIIVKTFDGAAGQSPVSDLTRMLREYPDVLVVPDFKDAESAAAMCEQAFSTERTVVTTTRAKEASEAILKLLEFGLDAEALASAVRLSVNMRLLRKLCEKCKEAYAPPPQLLQQLGIPAGRVEAFYRPPTPDPEKPQEPCRYCQGLGYFGRTGIFEMLVVDELVRSTLIEKPQVAAVRQAARKAGMRMLQEEGIVLVATGVTSLPELMRALKE